MIRLFLTPFFRALCAFSIIDQTIEPAGFTMKASYVLAFLVIYIIYSFRCYHAHSIFLSDQAISNHYVSLFKI